MVDRSALPFILIAFQARTRRRRKIRCQAPVFDADLRILLQAKCTKSSEHDRNGAFRLKMRNHLSYSEFLARSSSTLINVRKELTLHEIRKDFSIAQGVMRLVYIFPLHPIRSRAIVLSSRAPPVSCLVTPQSQQNTGKTQTQ